MSTDVFISYSSHDSHTAQALCSALEAADLSCWIAPRNITPGQAWTEAIIDGINEAEVIVLVYTTASNASPQVLREVERAVHKGLGLIAFRTQNVTPSKSLEYLISVNHWHEAYTGSLEEHLPVLVKSVLSLLAARRKGEEQPLASRPSAAISSPTASSYSPAQPEYNLPLQVTSFIGREQSLAKVKTFLSASPLVTLVGTGGVGKTRLALQAAAEVLSDYPDGVWLVELAPLSAPSLVVGTVAQTLGVKEQPGQALEQTLLKWLKTRKLLLVLDNCEHLLAACAHLATAVLRDCPQVRLLITSREVLNIVGEQLYRVPSLSLPPRNQTAPAAMLQQSDAVRFFMDRALLYNSTFALTDRNAPVLASLCHRLDGIPLALELAAARVRAMPLEQIEARLEDRFRLLTGGSRSSLPRQQTLRAMLDWSYDLLSEQEKLLLQRLSVFTGGWTLVAAEQVCSGEEIEEWEALDLLLSLSDKSLVVYEEQEGEGRYRLLETVRQYAVEKLMARGEAEEVRQKHQRFFLALAEEAEPLLTRPEQGFWLGRMESEHDNLRSALEAKDKEASLKIAGAIYWFWFIRGYWSEGRSRLAEALEQAGEGADASARANALNGSGMLAYHQGDHGSARTLWEQSLELRRELGDKAGIASLLNNLGNLDISGDFASARTLYEQSLELFSELQHKGNMAIVLENLGQVAYDQGDRASARTLWEQSLELRREIGDKWGISCSLNGLGNVASSEGDIASARALYEQSLTINRELGNKLGISYSLEGLAALAAAEGRTDLAGRVWGAAERLRKEIGAPHLPNECEEYDRQVAWFRQALGEEASSAVWAEGRAMTLEAAIEYALRRSSLDSLPTNTA